MSATAARQTVTACGAKPQALEDEVVLEVVLEDEDEVVLDVVIEVVLEVVLDVGVVLADEAST